MDRTEHKKDKVISKDQISELNNEEGKKKKTENKFPTVTQDKDVVEFEKYQ